MSTRITEQEIKTATKLASRKSGVTVSELAQQVNGYGEGRARKILKGLKGVKVTRTPIEGTKASRVLTYSLAK